MQIQKNNDRIDVILSQAFDSRIKMLNLCYALVFFFGGHFFVFRVLHSTIDSTAASVFGILFAIALYIASYRFFCKAVLFEKLLISNREVKWVEKKLFRSKTRSFDLKEITNFHFIEKNVVVPHPLAGRSMDYLGFETTDKMINQLGGRNQISFDYQGRAVYFEADIYSYEFDEIKSIFDS